MDAFLVDEEESYSTIEEWQHEQSVENCIIHHVHKYGFVYKPGRMKNDDIFSLAATLFNTGTDTLQDQPVSPQDSLVHADRLCGTWVLSLGAEDHRMVFTLHSLCTEAHRLRGRAHEWRGGRLVGGDRIEVGLRHSTLPASSLSGDPVCSTDVQWCVDSVVYGLMWGRARLAVQGNRLPAWTAVRLSTPAGKAVRCRGVRSHPEMVCVDCGNIEEDGFDYSRQGKEGVVVCTACGRCHTDNIDTGEAFRNFEGEKDRNHHGMWNHLFSDDFNFRTFAGPLRQREVPAAGSGRAAPRSTAGTGRSVPRHKKQCDTYKDNQKKDAFDIINAMSHTTDNPYSHTAASDKMTFPILSSRVLYLAKVLFAQMRDRGERITHFVSIVSACIIAAYWKADQKRAQPPGSIIPATLHSRVSTKKKRKSGESEARCLSDEQVLWRLCVPQLRQRSTASLLLRGGGDACKVCAIFRADCCSDDEGEAGDSDGEGDNGEEEGTHINRGLNSHLPRDHPMWQAAPRGGSRAAPAAPGSPRGAAGGSEGALELLHRRLPPAVEHGVAAPAAQAELLAPFCEHFLPDIDSYVLQWILKHGYIVDKHFEPELLEVGALQIEDTDRAAFIGQVLIRLWMQKLIEQRPRTLRCDACLEPGIVRVCWLVPELEALRRTVIEHNASVQRVISERAFRGEGGGVEALSRLAAAAGGAPAPAAGPPAGARPPKRPRRTAAERPPPTLSYRSVNPCYDLVLPNGWVHIAVRWGNETRISYRHALSRLDQWDPPPMQACHPDTHHPLPSEGRPGLAPLGDWAQCVAPNGVVGFRHTPSGCWRWQAPPGWPPLPAGWSLEWSGQAVVARCHAARGSGAPAPLYPVRHPVGQPMPVIPWEVHQDGKMISTTHTVRCPRELSVVTRVKERMHQGETEVCDRGEIPGMPFSLQHAMKSITAGWRPIQLARLQGALDCVGSLATSVENRLLPRAGGSAPQHPPLSVIVCMRAARLLMALHRRLALAVERIESGASLPGLLQPAAEPPAAEPSADVDAQLELLRPFVSGAEFHSMRSLLAPQWVGRGRGWDAGDREPDRVSVVTEHFKHTMCAPAGGGEVLRLRPGRSIWRHQKRVIDSIVGPRLAASGIVVVPCGGGKTVIGIGTLVRTGGSCLVLCNNSTSVRQWEEEFLRWTTLRAADICCIASDNRAPVRPRQIRECRVVISTYYMLMASGGKRQKNILQLARARRWRLSLLDEVHMVGARKIHQVVASVRARQLVGLTATPLREDDAFKELQFLIGPILHTVKWSALTEQGYLATIQNVNVICPMHPEVLRQYQGCRQDIRGKCISALNPSKIMACTAILRYHLARKHKVLIFFEELFVMKQYAKYLKDEKGMPLVKIESQERPEIIARATQQFRQGTINVLCLSRTGDCSLNVPDANVAIEVSSHEKSRRQRAQRLGRISRKFHRLGEPPRPDDDYESFFYTLVSESTKEMQDRVHREAYLRLQGYSFPTIQWRWGEDNAPTAQPGDADSGGGGSVRERLSRERMATILGSMQLAGAETEMITEQMLLHHQSIAASSAAPGRSRKKEGRGAGPRRPTLRQRFKMKPRRRQ